ncbi:MAG: alpha/beta fold hydrolase [Rhodospirillales bacterium]|nr:alpha/beta fold hydrolase [Rhodospirillales bacterium]
MTTKTNLILLPGLLCDEALWAHQAETLADIADITIADMTQDDTISGMAKRVLAAAPDKFALAGLSMGGYAAQEIMRQAPERVDRLALLDTSANVDTPEKTKQRKGFIAQLGLGDFKGVTAKLLPFLIHRDRLKDDALTDTIKASAANVGPDAFVRQQNAILNRPDGTGDLAKITCPTLVMCGRQDALTPLAQHEEMAAAIPNAALVIIEDCGHLTPLEQPHAASAAMRYWLSL